MASSVLGQSPRHWLSPSLSIRLGEKEDKRKGGLFQLLPLTLLSH